jgi:uncharacterized protein (TIGR03066 family)
MMALRVMAVSLALLGSAAGQVTQTKGPETAREMLTGAWEVTKVQSADKQMLTVGSTVAFRMENKLQIILIVNGQPISFEGTWSFDKDEITVTFAHEDKKRSQAIKIIKLTDDELITTNSDGLTIEYTKRKKHRIE